MVDAGALVSRVDEDVEADFGERAGKAAGLGADGVGDAAEGQVISFEAVLQDQLFRAEHGAEMAADEAVDGTGFDISFRATLFVPDAEAGARDHGEVARRLHFLIAAVDRLMEFHGALDADKGVDTDAVAVPDEADGFVCAHDLIHFLSPSRFGLGFGL